MLPFARSFCVEGLVLFSAVAQRRGLHLATTSPTFSRTTLAKCPLNRLYCQQQRCLSVSVTLHKGHNKWSNIKDIKAKKDDERSRRIAFYMKRFRIVVKEGGFDVQFNKKLGDLEKEYMRESLPTDTLHKFLQKLKDKPDICLTYQITGPGGSLFVVEMEGELKSRMQNALLKCMKKLPDFQLTDTLLGTEFEEKGVVTVDSITKQSKLMSFEEVEEIGIELECEEVMSAGRDGESDSEKFDLICDPKTVYQLEAKLTNFDFNVLSAETQLLPLNERVSLSGDHGRKVEDFLQALGELEYVKQIFDNLVEEDSSDQQQHSSAAN